jgi:hypothetical protein
MLRRYVCLAVIGCSPMGNAQIEPAGVQPLNAQINDVPDCAVTLVNGGRGGEFGNSSLVAMLPANGKIVFRPGGPGEILADGALSWKLGWTRRREGKLLIDGRRIDDAAPPLRARIPDGYGEIGFQSTALIFPTIGCWEVVGHVAGDALAFVILVEKVEQRN